MNNKYWEKFYQKKHIEKPSPFARWFIKQDIGADNKKLIDLGCGNGRDSYFLGSRYNVFGIDESKLNKDRGNVKFAKKTVLDVDLKNYQVVYNRFFLHAIRKEEQDYVLKNTPNLLVAEFRSDFGVRPDETHRRRLVNGRKFVADIIKNNFRIIYYTEGRGLAKYKGEDPVCIRVIAQKI